MRSIVLGLFAMAPLAFAFAGDPAKEPIVIPKPGAFKALVNPTCSHCVDEAKRRAGELKDDDRALCWIRGYSDGGAIPIRFFLAPYRVISDTYGVFVYDPDAGFARGFEKSLDFDFHGWRNGVMTMKYKDGTLYSCLTGIAFDGPKKGSRLKVLPTLVCDWGPWIKHYPHNVAYQMFDKYQPVELPKQPTGESLKSRGRADERLPADTMVLGVLDGKEAKAFKFLAKEVTWALAGDDLAVAWYGPTQTGAAYRPVAQPPDKVKAKPRKLTLQTVEVLALNAVWTDKETDSQWDIAGRGTKGELKGWTLEWVDCVQVKWFAWAAEYPKTTVHGG
jgi:hypothetical protein